jgi:peroxiredoxin
LTLHALDSLIAWDTAGRRVRLGTLWVDRAVVFLFVRHFGCLFSRQQVAEMAPHIDRIRSLGAELILVGNGSVEEARVFQAELQPTCPVLTDPSRQTYCTLGMRRGLHRVLRPAVLLRAVEARRQGFRQSRVAGDPYQQGGIVIIAGSREVYRFISESPGDRPEPDTVMAALERARERADRPSLV